MKKIITLFLSFCSISLIAQEKYEVFQYEDKYGVVEEETLSEFIKPTYTGWNNYFDPIILINGSEYTFIDRTTGNAENFTSTNEDLRFNGNYYMHFYKDGKSVFIPKTGKNKIYFNKRYHNAIGNGSDLIVEANGYYDVYTKSNFKTPKLKNISASKVFKGMIFRKKTNKEEYVTIFYGKDTIFAYDRNYQLLKKYPSSVSYESRMFDAISENFTKKEEEDYPPVMGLMPEYFSSKFNNGYTTFASNRIESKAFKIKGNFSYRIVYGKNDWILLTEKDTDKKYAFKIDFEKHRFLMPKQYQEVLELQFVE